MNILFDTFGSVAHMPIRFVDGSIQSQKQVLTLKALSNASARRDAEEEGDDEIEDNRPEWQKDDVIVMMSMLVTKMIWLLLTLTTSL